MLNVQIILLRTNLQPILNPSSLESVSLADVKQQFMLVVAMPNDHVIAKLDFTSAFNCSQRDVMLETILRYVPKIFACSHLFCSNSTLLKFNSSTIISDQGIQQRDPLGPLLFALPFFRCCNRFLTSLSLAI